jgi:hypothetical protein
MRKCLNFYFFLILIFFLLLARSELAFSVAASPDMASSVTYGKLGILFFNRLSFAWIERSSNFNSAGTWRT